MFHFITFLQTGQALGLGPEVDVPEHSGDTQVRLLLLAALCGEHLVLLGPPGTAKSELARRLSGLTSGTYFERLLTRFSVPEELFGPLSMRGVLVRPYASSFPPWLDAQPVQPLPRDCLCHLRRCLSQEYSACL